MSELLQDRELKTKENAVKASLDVRLSRSLKVLQSDGYLSRDDRGHGRGMGVYYSIPESKNEVVKYQIYAKDELPSKIRLLMKKIGPDRRILILGFPLIPLYSALLRLKEGNREEFEFFLTKGKEMTRLAAEAYWEDLIDEYAASSRLSKQLIEESLSDLEGTLGRTNIIVRMALEHDLIGVDLVTVIESALLAEYLPFRAKQIFDENP